MDPIKILVVDDHTLFREGLIALLNAAPLNISGKTVSNHISNIFNKLPVADRAQAMIRAREAGLK
jgi:DNA-binding NarL/FixJ family response regulator